MSQRIDAFIPLKGHSERVPDKNMRDFGGRPLFHVIVATLQGAQRIGAVYIDTDSDEIALSAADLSGVTVIRRRPDLVGDDVSVNRLIASFLDGYEGEHLLQTHATNPLLRSETIDAAVEAYFEAPAITSLFAVTRHQARFYDNLMRPINHDPSELIPTQDLDPLYVENSNFYIFNRDAFFEHHRRVTDATRMYEVDPMEAIDIDDESDFALALALAQAADT